MLVASNADTTCALLSVAKVFVEAYMVKKPHGVWEAFAWKILED